MNKDVNIDVVEILLHELANEIYNNQSGHHTYHLKNIDIYESVALYLASHKERLDEIEETFSVKFLLTGRDLTAHYTNDSVLKPLI